MKTEKKYFWFKLNENFFHRKEIKKLRSIAGGDTYVLIYLKIILLSLKTGGKLYFEGIDDNFASEIALEIDENKDNVLVTLEFLLKHSAVIQENENIYYVNEVNNNIVSQTSTALRVQNYRKKLKQQEIEQKEYICNTDVTPVKQIDNGEIEIEIEIEKDIYICKEKKIRNQIPPTAEMVKDFCNQRKNNLDYEQFINFYNSKGWMIGKNKMKDWQAAIYTWEKNNKKEKGKSLTERMKEAGVI